jgi:hypothetical protein
MLTDVRTAPFPHSSCSQLVDPPVLEAALTWMETTAPWRLQVASFYEQWEMHLDQRMVPDGVRSLIDDSTVEMLVDQMVAPLSKTRPRLRDVTAHKLVPGQTIKVHNDYLGGEETHRLVLQLNRGWQADQGGLLMLFSSSSASDVQRILIPRHGSAVAFAITPTSFHAVSTVKGGERYTLVYSFGPPEGT